MFTVSILQEMFPPRSDCKAAVTGYIPIDFFNAVEPYLRPMLRRKKLRVFYRGPRVSNSHSTRRENAFAAVIYTK